MQSFCREGEGAASGGGGGSPKSESGAGAGSERAPGEAVSVYRIAFEALLKDFLKQ